MSESSGSTNNNKNECLLSKEEEVKSLNLRGGPKKEKRDMGDFDDA